MTTVKLGLLPIWNPRGAPEGVDCHLAVIVQAYHSAALVQKVGITGPGLNAALIASSAANSNFGTCFLSRELLPGPQPRYPLIYTVELKYSENGQDLDPAVFAVQGTQLGPTCVTAFAFANDKNDGPGCDADFNDTVVSISLFPYSQDPPPVPKP